MSEAKKKANTKYESKRVIKPISFNTETEKELLQFASSVDFSNWVKQNIKESIGADMEQLEKVYEIMDSALEQYRLDKSDLHFGRAQGAAKLALELSIITADQFVIYTESLIWERNNA